jgi:hypothetical protein
MSVTPADLARLPDASLQRHETEKFRQSRQRIVASRVAWSSELSDTSVVRGEITEGSVGYEGFAAVVPFASK